MVRTTRKQREALFRIFQRDFPSWVSPGKRINHMDIRTGIDIVPVPTIQWRRFRKQVVGYSDGSGCVMLPWKNMWLGIEVDGYTHS
jgi:hypothetical protein